MSNQKSVSIDPIRLEKKEESMEVFPIEDRISLDLSESEVFDQAEKMGMESVVVNGLIPYRDALHTLEKNYIHLTNRVTESGIDMATEPFIPQYLKFEEKNIEGKGIFYIKDNVTCFASGDKWFFINELMDIPVSLKIDNMLQAFHILKAFGANVDISDYLSE